MTDNNQKSYRELHKPKSQFGSREEYLEHELTIMSPRRWGINLPLRDFTVALHWSQRFENDPGNRWLRGLIEQLFKE